MADLWWRARWNTEQQFKERSNRQKEDKYKKNKRKNGLKQGKEGEGKMMEAIPTPHNALSRRGKGTTKVQKTPSL